MLGTLPLRLRPPGTIPQGQPQLDPNDQINVGLQALYLPGTTNYDITGKQQPLASSTPPTPSPSIFGNVAKFNGSQFLNIPFSASLSLSVGSWCFWLNLTSAIVSGNFTTFLAQGYDGSTQPIYFDCRNPDGSTAGTNLSFQSFPGGTSVGVMSTLDLSLAVNVNRWFFVTGVYDGTNFKIYINGVLNTSATGFITAFNTKEFNIGCVDLNGTNARFVTGYIWGVRILNRVLLPFEILRLYTNPFTGLIFPGDFNIGMFGGTSAPVASPFFVPNFDLRPNIKINPDLRSFTDDRVINLIGSDSVYAGPGQVPAYELKTAPRVPARKDYVKSTDIQLIGQDIIYGSPGQVTSYDNSNPVRRKAIEPISWFQNLLQSTLNIIFFPFAQLDWPNPNRRKNDINKTWRDNSKIQLIGQDTFFGAPGQTKVYDYPNPILRKDDVTKRTWIASLVYGISTTIVLAQQAWNWNKNTYSLIFNYNLAQRAWQWVPNSSIIQYAILLATKAWQWKGQSPIFSGGNFNKVKRVIQAFMVSINRFMNK